MRLFLIILCCGGAALAQPHLNPQQKPTRYFGLSPIAGQPRKAPAVPDLAANAAQTLLDLQTQPKNRYGNAKIYLTPGQACSIPLLHVTPKDTRDRMEIPIGDSRNIDRMPQFRGPAPSCDDVKR